MKFDTRKEAEAYMEGVKAGYREVLRSLNKFIDDFEQYTQPEMHIKEKL